MLTPRLGFRFGFVVAVERTPLAAIIANLDLYLVFVVRHHRHDFEFDFHILCFLLLERAVGYDIDTRLKDLAQSRVVVEHHTAIEYGLAVFQAEKGADIILFEVSEQLRHRVAVHSVLTDILLTKHIDRAVDWLIIEQGFKRYRFV